MTEKEFKLFDDSPARIYLNSLIEQRKSEGRTLGGKKTSRTVLSTAIGKSRSYLHQYLVVGKPEELPLEVRFQLAKYLDGDPEKMADGPTPDYLRSKFDKNAIADVIRIVEEWLISEKLDLSPEDKAELIIALYPKYINLPQEIAPDQRKAVVIEFAKIYQERSKIA